MSKPKHVSQFFSDVLSVQESSHSSYRSSRQPAKIPSASSKSSAQAEIFDFLTLVRSWPTVVGEMLGANTLPLKISSGTLIVLTKHSIFAHELGFMSECIKKKIFQMFPQLQKYINKIHFKVGQGLLRETQEAFHSQQSHKNLEEFPLPSLKEQLLHPFSPVYKKLKKEAEVLLHGIDIEDKEVKELFISLYMQNMQKSHKI